MNDATPRIDWSRSAPSDALAWNLLVVLGLVNLLRGGIHLFADDGGAASIAGFDIAGARELVVALFAVMGLHQVSLGIADLLVGLRWRALAVPLLWFHALHQLGVVWLVFFHRSPPGRAPGEIAAPILLAILWGSLYVIHRMRAGGTAPLGRAETT